jgi:MOSC domain-containing protein
VFYLLAGANRRLGDTEAMSGHVKRISIAPVKSLGLIHPDSVELGRSGVVGDRRFWMVNDEGRLVNGKRCPQLMAVRPAWAEESGRLTLRFPDGQEVDGEVELGGPVEAELYGEPHPSRQVEGPWQDALERYAGFPLTLLWSERGAVDRGSDRRGWMSIVSRASLERLGDVAGAGHVDGRRFRMLFEIDGVGAHEEDSWIGRPVQIGGAVVQPVGDVGRCVVTKCDPDTGTSDLDTLGALALYRRQGQTEPLPFGVYGEVVEPGRVRIDDPIGASPAT